MMNEDRPMTVDELQEYLKCGRNTVLNLIHDKKVAAKKVGKKWLVMKSEIDRYLKEFDTK